MGVPHFLFVLLAGQEPDLAESLRRAPWAEATGQGVTMAVRAAPLFSARMHEALARPDALPPDVRGAVERAVRVTLPKPGWYFDTAVPAGTYYLGFDRSPSNLRLTLRDEEGKPLRSLGYWVDPPTSSVPSVAVEGENGAVMTTLRCDGIRLSYRYVTREAHDRLVAGREYSAGRVKIVSDLDAPEALAVLAREADATIAAHSASLGRPVPAGPFRIHLFTAVKTFESIDLLLTGGRFRRNEAFVPSLTGEAYVWYGARADAAALRDLAIPSRIRATVFHELHHQVARALRPGAGAWPGWLKEGLAEAATEEALRGRSSADGAAYHDLILGRWRFAEGLGNVPPAEDLLAPRVWAAELSGFYGTAYLLVRSLRSRPEELKAMLDRLEPELVDANSAAAAREELERRWGPAEGLLRRTWEAARKAPPPPAMLLGSVDRTGGQFRIATPPEAAGRVILQDALYGPSVRLEASIAWVPCGGRQADFYLAFKPGREATGFLKVAVLPGRVVLFRFSDGQWSRWGTSELARPLAEGAGVWHRVKVELDAEAKRVGVELNGEAVAGFPLRGPVPSAEARAGIGAYDGVVYFKDVRAR